MKSTRSILVVLALVAFAPDAGAHIALMSPKPRTSELKEGPCGVAGDKRGTTVTTFTPGQTITVQWKETVSHTGHFRISFDEDGQNGFVDPKSFTDLNTAPTVLVDDIKDKSGTQIYTQEVTLPDVECERCTLQVIQVMTDKPPYGDGNDLYYQCADITLSKAAVAEEDAGATAAEKPQSASNEGSGCRTSTVRFEYAEGVLFALVAITLARVSRRKRG